MARLPYSGKRIRQRLERAKQSRSAPRHICQPNLYSCGTVHSHGVNELAGNQETARIVKLVLAETGVCSTALPTDEGTLPFIS